MKGERKERVRICVIIGGIRGIVSFNLRMFVRVMIYFVNIIL